MGTFSSSFIRSKPLFFLSLAASLALYAGEEETPFPQVERGEAPFVLTEQNVALELEHGEGNVSLDISSYTPSLIGDEWVTKKGKHLEGKKGTRFHQAIEVEEDLAPSPYVAADEAEGKGYNPYIEKRRRAKASFPKHFNVEKWEDSPSSLFSFDHPRWCRHEIGIQEDSSMREVQGTRWKEPQSGLLKQGNAEISHRRNLRDDHLVTTPSKEQSELIRRKHQFQKEGNKGELALDLTEKHHHFAQMEDLEKKEELPCKPTLEHSECPMAAVEESHFYPEESFATSPLYPFPMEDILVKEEVSRSFSIEKDSFPKNSSFATTTFDSLERADVEDISETRIAMELKPTHQECGEHWTFELKAPSIDTGTSSPCIPFEENPLSFKVDPPKSSPLAKTEISFQQRAFEHNPYIYMDHHGEEVVQAEYFPEKEGVFPDPIRYPLPAGPSIAMEMEGDVFSFTPSPSFDLFTSKDGKAPPKKLQKFVASSLEISHPYFSQEAFEELASRAPSPQLEPSEVPKFHQQAPEVDAALESSKSTFDFPKEEEGLSLIGSRMDIPDSQRLSKQRAIEPEESPYVSTFHKREEGKNTFLPSSETLPLSLSLSASTLIPSSTESLVPFSLGEGESETFEMQQRDSFAVKGDSGEHSTLAARSFTVPNVKDKGITPKKGVSSPYGKINLESPNISSRQELQPAAELQDERALTSRFPDLEIATHYGEAIPFNAGSDSRLTLKEDEKRFDKKPLSRSLAAIKLPKTTIAVAKARQEKEEISLTPTPIPYESKADLHEPVHPAFYPPEVPHLAMNESIPSMVEQNLEYTKKALEGECSLDLPLPYLGTKTITPKKGAFAPKKTLEDLPAVEIVAQTVELEKLFPNTRALLEKEQAPSRIPAEVEMASREIQEVETDMIHSQAREILEDYDQENGASSGMIALKHPELNKGVSQEKARLVNQSRRFTQAFLTEIPPPAYLETVTYANEFDAEVHYAKRDDGMGYLFALKLKPKPSLNFSSPHQNFIYVIDGSSSIKKHRFGVFKEGVSRSMDYMKKGDSFNILVADAEVIPMSKQSVAISGRSKQQARKFLEERKYRGFFINYDPFDLLEKVTPYLDPEKDNVIVLISDGKGFKTFKAHKEDFQELVEASKGRFSIFTATASNDNNLSMLDLLSTFNGGEFMYSKTHSAFSRQLARMVRHVENLIAKDMRVHVTDRKVETGIEFYPDHQSLPSLYSDKAYTIYGTIDQLKDFDLILQGRCGDQWINIKQHISFQHAEKASNKIKRGFALQKAYVCYDYYLKQEDPFFLNEAERILNPHTIPTATR